MIQTAMRRLAAVLPVRGTLLPMTALAWMAMVEIASAQPANAPPAAKEYFLQYLLVGLCIALGMLAALRPSPRRDPEGGAVSWFSMSGGGHGAEAPAKPGERRKAPHRGTKLLIISLVGLLICPIFSLMGMSMSKEDLAAMKAARMDRAGEQLANVSFWISVGGLVLWLVIGLIITLVALL
ncbi:MAG: hypothetical protein SGJ19_13215 [Planctomycetia bacterium]|nr:hypothetical protein [Planctomycetia bacterium]